MQNEMSCAEYFLFNTINEEDFNQKFSPLLQYLSGHDPNGVGTVLCNSERCKWLPGESNNYKLDFHVNHLAFNYSTAPLHFVGIDYVFGGIVHDYNA